MVIVTIILFALFFGWFFGVLWLRKRGKNLAATSSMCSKCGGITTATADPSNSRIVILCKDEKCRHSSSRSVRASALSLFGILQILFTVLAGALGYKTGQVFGYQTFGKAILILVCALLGGIIMRFIIRGVVLTMLQYKPSMAWQEEIVAYLAPPPFLNRKI